MDKTDYAIPGLVHELVEQAVATYPTHLAVVAGEATLTYAQLNERAEKLSWAILHHAPAAELVGISTTRGLVMVVGLLAILKAGKAYFAARPGTPGPAAASAGSRVGCNYLRGY